MAELTEVESVRDLELLDALREATSMLRDRVAGSELGGHHGLELAGGGLAGLRERVVVPKSFFRYRLRVHHLQLAGKPVILQDLRELLRVLVTCISQIFGAEVILKLEAVVLAEL